MKKLLLCASLVLVCYFASDAVRVRTYPFKATTLFAAVRTATAK